MSKTQSNVRVPRGLRWWMVACMAIGSLVGGILAPRLFENRAAQQFGWGIGFFCFGVAGYWLWLLKRRIVQSRDNDIIAGDQANHE